ncbi:MAG: hypothetical protein ACM3NW_01890 [Syntrophomonadaceae bacterium]
MKATRGPSLEAVFLAALVLRAMAWVFLLPPWAGFDEAFHQSYALDQAERLRWPGFGGVTLREDVAREVRRWTLLEENRRLAAGVPNYETQQSPLYYWASGLCLRALPGLEPLPGLYLLRLGNAALLLASAVLTARAARRLFAGSAWLPVAYLALLPGLGVALCRVSNDALATLLISIAVAATLPEVSARFAAAGALAAGLSPWAKLYGLASIPGSVLAALRGRSRVLRLGLAVLPAIALLSLSRVVLGRIFPLQENLVKGSDAGLLEVPWWKDLWSLAKTHVFVAGVPSLVFPKPVYLIALAALAFAAIRTLGCWRREGSTLVFLAMPLVLFVLSLLYHAWRSYSAVREPGGTGGWYFWSMLLPESLFMTWGLARRPAPARWRTPALAFFVALTAAGDAILLGLPSNSLVVRGQEVFGFRAPSLAAIGEGLVASRPPVVAALAVAFTLGSWALLLAGTLLSSRAATDDPSRRTGSPA